METRYISLEAAKSRAVNLTLFGRDIPMVSVSELEKIPPANVRPVTPAKWKMEFIGGNWNDHWNYICPVCHEEFMDLKKSNFCPCCGTYMRPEEAPDES